MEVKCKVDDGNLSNGRYNTDTLYRLLHIEVREVFDARSVLARRYGRQLAREGKEEDSIPY